MVGKTIQFGSMRPVDFEKIRKDVKVKRSGVPDDGLEHNGFTKYDHEVSFANIRATANICRVKDDDATDAGVAKGCILAGVPITVPKNDAAATTHAMKKRCDYAPPSVNMEKFAAGSKLLMDKFEPQPEIRVDEVLLQEYFDTCRPAKAARLLEVWEAGEMKFDGGSKHVFAKQEVLLKNHQAQPRVVYQGTDMYNAVTGVVVMELTRRMKAIFCRENPKNTGNVVIFACGVSGEDMGDIVGNAEGVMIESDFRNNDGSQSKAMRKYEAMFYMKLGAPLWFVKEFTKNTSVRVWTRYGIEATVVGQRWSGESTTTTGNSYVGMALMLQSMKEAGVEKSYNIHGGDDYLGIVVGDVSNVKVKIEEVVSSAGMTAEVSIPQSRDHGTFYRKRYVRSVNGCRPVPQFGRVLAKLNLRANQNSQVNDRDYMAGKYMSAAYEHRFVPLIRDLLLEKASTMSNTPWFDCRATKLAEMGGPEAIRRRVEQSSVVDLDSFSGFLGNVYGITFDELYDSYSRVASSCVDYLDGYTFVDKKTVKTKKGYRPAQLAGITIDALVAADV